MVRRFLTAPAYWLAPRKLDWIRKTAAFAKPHRGDHGAVTVVFSARARCERPDTTDSWCSESMDGESLLDAEPASDRRVRGGAPGHTGSGDKCETEKANGRLRHDHRLRCDSHVEGELGRAKLDHCLQPAGVRVSEWIGW